MIFKEEGLFREGYWEGERERERERDKNEGRSEGTRRKRFAESLQ